VVREVGGGWELREGIAWEGSGEVSVTAMAREKRFGRKLVGLRFGLWDMSLGILVLVWVREEARGRRLMIFMESHSLLLSIHSVHFGPSFSFQPQVIDGWMSILS
jgi:hypothetical protein